MSGAIEITREQAEAYQQTWEDVVSDARARVIKANVIAIIKLSRFFSDLVHSLPKTAAEVPQGEQSAAPAAEETAAAAVNGELVNGDGKTKKKKKDEQAAA